MKADKYSKPTTVYERKIVKPVNDKKVMDSDADWYFKSQGKLRGK